MIRQRSATTGRRRANLGVQRPAWSLGGLVGLSLVLTCASSPAMAATGAEAPPPHDNEAAALLDMPIEQLMNIEVTSVGKKPQRLAVAAGAISVITQEDIARSGMTSIPELLRLVPGLDVAQADSRHWAISARGFNDTYSSKLLVLVDGRSVYTPLFAGVLWDQQITPLPDIERIEVIRGPGATLWGANAVNGVINITTKKAGDTQGLAGAATVGSEGAVLASVRYGGALSDTLAYRIFGETSKQSASVTPTGEGGGDGWREGRVGARLDWTPTAADSVSVQGEYFRERMRGVFYPPSLIAAPAATDTLQHNRGGHALISWSHQVSAESDVTFQAYFDDATTEEYTDVTTVRTYDVEARHRFQAGARHEIVWGAGYRKVEYEKPDTFNYLGLIAPSGGEQIVNVFAQDEFALGPTLHLIGGVKLEHQSYVGWESEPSLRMVWEPTPTHTVWAAVSRAVRMPAFSDELLRLDYAGTPGSPQSLPVLISVLGNPGRQLSERLTAWEAGYRGALTPRVGVDVAVFYNDYSRLASYSAEPPQIEATPAPLHVLVPIRVGNLLAGETYGAEVSANWQVTPNWRLVAAYSLLRGKITGDDPGLSAANQLSDLGRSPRHQFQVQSRLDLPGRTQFDVAVYRVGAVPTGNISAYTRLDLRLGWRVTDQLTVSLAGQNLLQAQHQEFGPIFFAAPREVPRTVYLTTTMGF